MYLRAFHVGQARMGFTPGPACSKGTRPNRLEHRGYQDIWVDDSSASSSTGARDKFVSTRDQSGIRWALKRPPTDLSRRFDDSRLDIQKRRRELGMGVAATGRSKPSAVHRPRAWPRRKDHPAQLPTHQVIEGQGGSWGSRQSRKTYKFLLPLIVKTCDSND